MYFGVRISKIFFVFFQITILLVVPINSYSGTSEIITNTGVKSVNVGDHSKSVRAIFGAPYKVVDSKKAQWARMLVVYEKKEKILQFSVDGNDKIFLIDIFGNFKTKEGIGVGSLLSQTAKAYGKGSIQPSDSGYYVYFESYPGLMFLLNNSEIPEDLRDIPDDVITEEEENKILKLKNVKISTIQIIQEYE
jgi:hypothetical protein